jgi:hypothetical protein
VRAAQHDRAVCGADQRWIVSEAITGSGKGLVGAGAAGRVGGESVGLAFAEQDVDPLPNRGVSIWARMSSLSLGEGTWA